MKITENNEEIIDQTFSVVAKLSKDRVLLKTFKYGKQQYLVNFATGINVTLLMDEFLFISKYFPRDVMHSYVAYRYGLSSFLFRSKELEVLDYSNDIAIAHAVLYLLSTMRKVGVVYCVHSSLLHIEDFICSKSITPKENDPKVTIPTGLLKSDIDKFSQQEKIFDVVINNKKSKLLAAKQKDAFYSKRQTTTTMENFLSVVTNALDSHDGKPPAEPKFFNYIFNLDLGIFPALSTFKAIKDGEKSYVLNKRVLLPEVYEVLKGCNSVKKFMGISTVPTTTPEHYSHEKEVFSSIRGVSSRSKVSSFIKGITIKETGLLPKEVDPFLSKSILINNEGTPNLYFISNRLEKFVAKFYGVEIDYAKWPSFKNYRISISGTSREELVTEFNCYPMQVWNSYFKWAIETGANIITFKTNVPAEKSKEYSLFRRKPDVRLIDILTLNTISVNDEYQLNLLRQTVKYSEEVGLFAPEDKEKSKVLHSDLLTAAQTLVSQALIPRGVKKRDVLSKPTSSIPRTKILACSSEYARKVDATVYKKIKKLTLIRWDTFKAASDRKFPLLCSLMSTRAMALVASHHDFADSLLGPSLTSGLAYTTKNEISRVKNEHYEYSSEDLLLTCVYTNLENEVSVGLYSKQYKRHVHATTTPGYHSWFKGRYLQEGSPVIATSKEFMQDEILLEEQTTTITTRVAAADRKTAVRDAKAQIQAINNYIIKDLQPRMMKCDMGSQDLEVLTKEREDERKKMKALTDITKNSRSMTVDERSQNAINNEHVLIDIVSSYYDNSVAQLLHKRLSKGQEQKIDVTKANPQLIDFIIKLMDTRGNRMSVESKETESRAYFGKELSKLTIDESNCVVFNLVTRVTDQWRTPFISLLIESIRLKGSSLAIAQKFMRPEGSLTTEEVALFFKDKKDYGTTLCTLLENLHTMQGYISDVVTSIDLISPPDQETFAVTPGNTQRLVTLLEQATYEKNNKTKVASKRRRLKNLFKLYRDDFYSDMLFDDLDSIGYSIQEYRTEFEKVAHTFAPKKKNTKGDIFSRPEKKKKYTYATPQYNQEPK